jgi:PAS domain S-box-containing protein
LVETWNSGAERIIGYQADQIIGLSIEIFYTDDEIRKGEPESSLRQARENGHFEKEGWRIRKDGSLFWANTVLSAMFDEDGVLQGYVKITRDISERREHEEQLQFLTHQVNQSNDAIYTMGIDYAIKSWNKGAEKLYGFTENEAIGRFSHELLQTDLSLHQVDEAVEHLQKHDYWVGELKRRSKTGRDVYIHASTTIVRDTHGTITGYVAVNLDISERKKMEERLQSFNQELEHQVRDKTAEVTSILERITDSFVALDKDFRCLYLNKKAAQLIQRDPATLIGKTLTDELPDIVDTLLYKTMMDAMASQQSAVVTEYYQALDITLDNYIYPSPNGLSLFIRDITEKRKTERQLQKAHDRLLFHVENAPLGFIEWDSKLSIRSWSRRAEEIFGWSEQEIISLQARGKLSGSDIDVPPFDILVRDMLKGNVERKTVERRNHTKDGRTIWCEWFNSVIRDEEGNVVTVLSLVQDITEKRRAEKELMSSYAEKQVLAERLSTILNTLPARVALLDERGIIVEVNEAWKSPGGANKLLDNSCTVNSDYLAIATEAGKTQDQDDKNPGKGIQAVLSGQLHEFVMVYSSHSNDNRQWFRMIVTPLQKKEKTGAVVMHIDITDQKLGEERLRLSEQKYKFLFDSNPMPMWMRSMDDKRIIDVNKAACEAYGFTREEMLAMGPLDLRHPDEIEAFMLEFQKEVPVPTNRGVWKHRRKDNTYIDVEIFVQDIIYNRRKARLILAKDVTEHRKAEAQLNQSYQEIRRLASHLQNIREEERTRMAREIHDQLGQQLTVMKMDISWLYKKLTEADRPVRDRMTDLKNIMEETVKLIRRISSDLRPSLLDDMGLLAAIEWHLLEMEKRSGIAIELTGLKEEPALSTESKTNLFRILQESLTNVGRYAQARKVQVDLSRKENLLVMTISDDGVGFDKEKVASKRTLGILGMRERTAMMGGTYVITSAPGEGTTVLVTVPLNS